MLLADFLSSGTRSLTALYPEQEARSIVLMLCESLIGTHSYTPVVDPGYEIRERSLPALEQAMARLQEGEPIQYVLGSAEFCGRRFRVTPDTLIPRPETELLCREAVRMVRQVRNLRLPFGRDAAPVRILDLCTGSGNIAWTLALEVPGVEVVGVDLSEGALSVASSQDFKAELKASSAIPPKFVRADVLDTEQDFPYGPFDAVLSNPPYVRESEKASMRRNVLAYEPASALFVPDADPLLFYRAVARLSDRFLTPEGKGMTEINEALGEETAAVFRSEGFREVVVHRDFFEKSRFVFYSR